MLDVLLRMFGLLDLQATVEKRFDKMAYTVDMLCFTMDSLVCKKYDGL